MSQPSLKEKFDDEQVFNTTLAIELENVKKTLAQQKLDTTKPTHKGPFSLSVKNYKKNFFKDLESIDSRLEKIESGNNPATGIFR